MSFGFSAGDAILLTQLAWRTVQNSRKACGEHDELTQQATSLHAVIQRLEQEMGNPESLFNNTNDGTREGTLALLSGCEKTLRILDRVLEKYNALSETERRGRKLWLRIRFGNGRIADMAEVRVKLTYYTSALSLFLNIVSIGSAGRVEQRISNARVELREIKTAVNCISAHMMAAGREGTILTSYADDEKAVWKEFRRELIADGFRSEVILKNKSTIKAYVRELGERGFLTCRDTSPTSDPPSSLPNNEVRPTVHTPPEDHEDELPVSIGLDEPLTSSCSSGIGGAIRDCHEDIKLRSSSISSSRANLAPIKGRLPTRPKKQPAPRAEVTKILAGSSDVRSENKPGDEFHHGGDWNSKQSEQSDDDFYDPVDRSCDTLGTRSTDPKFQLDPKTKSKSMRCSESADTLYSVSNARTSSDADSQLEKAQSIEDPDTQLQELSQHSSRHPFVPSSEASIYEPSTTGAPEDFGDNASKNLASKRRNDNFDYPKLQREEDENPSKEAVKVGFTAQGTRSSAADYLTIDLTWGIWQALDGDAVIQETGRTVHAQVAVPSGATLSFVNVAADNFRLIKRVLIKLLAKRVSETSIKRRLGAFRVSTVTLWQPGVDYTRLAQRLEFMCIIVRAALRKLSRTPWMRTMRETRVLLGDPRYLCLLKHGEETHIHSEETLLKQLWYIMVFLATGLVPAPDTTGKILRMDLPTESHHEGGPAPRIPMHDLYYPHPPVRILDLEDHSQVFGAPLYTVLLKRVEAITGRQHFVKQLPPDLSTYAQEKGHTRGDRWPP